MKKLKLSPITLKYSNRIERKYALLDKKEIIIENIFIISNTLILKIECEFNFQMRLFLTFFVKTSIIYLKRKIYYVYGWFK